jgi:predicted enzyme related to lactoylglutathione lyase
MSPGLYCIELRTSQWASLIEWYRTALGLKVLVRVVDDGYALLDAGHTRLALIARETRADASARWSLAFEVEDLELAAARLLANGSAASQPAPNAEGFRELLTNDPDGNRIRLVCWPERG